MFMLWSYALETGFDLCDHHDLENWGHASQTNRLPRGPMGKLYTKDQYESCNTFWVIAWKYVLLCATPATSHHSPLILPILYATITLYMYYLILHVYFFQCLMAINLVKRLELQEEGALYKWLLLLLSSDRQAGGQCHNIICPSYDGCKTNQLFSIIQALLNGAQASKCECVRASIFSS